jgi:uncharacterized membrane protein
MNEIALQHESTDEQTDAHAIRQSESAISDCLPQNISQTERVASCLGGSALLIGGLIRGRLSGLLLSGIGGALLYRGMTGHCHGYDALGVDTNSHNPATAVPARQGAKIEKTIAVNRSVEDLYACWSDLPRLPKFMQHLESVQQLEGGRSHWVAQGPRGKRLEWDAEIINQRENEMISWRSLPDSEVDTAGSVHFKSLGHDRGTAVKVSLKYNPPGGKLTEKLAALFGGGLEQELAEDLRRFKSIMEAGEVPTHG